MADTDLKEPALESEDLNADKKDDDDEEEDEPESQTKGKDNKKKKKKAKGKKDEKKPGTGGTISAAGRAILLKQQQLAEEEARFKKLQEEEEARIRELERKEEEERKLIEDEKERKRKAKQDKVEAKKAAGTYLTKAEKEKQRKAQMKLESMRASGLISDTTNDDHDSSVSSAGASVTQSSLYGKSKKNQHKVNKEKQEEEVTIISNESKADVPQTIVNPTEDDVDDWDVDDSVLDSLAASISQKMATETSNRVEDHLELENKAEQERLRQLGLERARRDEEARIKREIEEREHAELQRKEREIAQRKETSRKARKERELKAMAERSADRLRSPISCIMGHVDTGKTKLLDKIRHTNVQEGEAGGITQQIGATQFSRETLIRQIARIQNDDGFEVKIPGLLMIDTPGHESFSNLRNRGSSLCDIAVLVIDLMHGMEPQTLESLNLLKKKKVPFIVALNKIDRCYGWQSEPDRPFRESLAAQDENCRLEFKDRASRAIVQLMEQGLNAKLFWENDDLAHTVSLVPTSAITGEGVPDLLRMLMKLSQEKLTERIMYTERLQCTVLEVKVVDGLGHTVDVVLVNGTLREGDTIIVSTLEGPVHTTVRALLTPPPNMEMRIKSEYVHHQSISGAIGVKIVAPDISRAVAGTPLMVLHQDDDLDEVMEEVQSDLTSVLKALSTEQRGVIVHASTLGALEALLQFLRDECKPPIPVCHISIGPIHKKDIIRAGIMHEKGFPEFATILAFDVKMDNEATAMAEELKVRVFSADIIYHLFDQFSAYMQGIFTERKKAAEAIAVYPVALKILPQHIFNMKNPIVIGVEVVDGVLKLGTMLTIPTLGHLDVGRVVSIENNRKEVQSAKKGTSVAIKILNEANPTITYGRQFDHTSTLYSKISRESIDALKEFFKEDVSKEDWQLIVRMKKLFNIP